MKNFGKSKPGVVPVISIIILVAFFAVVLFLLRDRLSAKVQVVPSVATKTATGKIYQSKFFTLNFPSNWHDCKCGDMSYVDYYKLSSVPLDPTNPSPKDAAVITISVQNIPSVDLEAQRKIFAKCEKDTECIVNNLTVDSQAALSVDETNTKIPLYKRIVWVKKGANVFTIVYEVDGKTQAGRNSTKLSTLPDFDKIVSSMKLI